MGREELPGNPGGFNGGQAIQASLAVNTSTVRKKEY